MKEHSYLIREVAEQATTAYCQSTECESCKYLGFSHNCSTRCRTEIALKIVTDLAIEEVKEIIHESKN